MVQISYTTVFAISVLSLVGPSIQASAVIKTAAHVVGGVLGGQKRDLAPEVEAKLNPLIAPCLTALKNDKKPQVKVNKVKGLAQLTVPAICVENFKTVQGQSWYPDLEKTEGKVTILNPTTLGCSGGKVPDAINQLLKVDQAAAKGGKKATPGSKPAKGSKPAQGSKPAKANKPAKAAPGAAAEAGAGAAKEAKPAAAEKVAREAEAEAEAEY